MPNKRLLRLVRMYKVPNLLSNSNNKQLQSLFNKLMKLKWPFKRLKRTELPNRNKIKSIEKMPSSQPCKRLRRKL